MLRYFFKETEVQLLLTPIVCGVFGLVFAAISTNGFLLLTGLVIAVLYITIHFLSVQQEYAKMLHVMPIGAQHIVRMHFSYLLIVALLYTALFLFGYAVFDAFFGTLNWHFFKVVSLCISFVLFVVPLVLVLFYMWKRFLSIVLSALLLVFWLWGAKLLQLFVSLDIVTQQSAVVWFFPPAATLCCLLLYRLATKLYTKQPI